MNDNELDAVYTRLCKVMTDRGADNAPLFLARFAMLAIVELGTPATVLRLIEEAEGTSAQAAPPV